MKFDCQSYFSDRKYLSKIAPFLRTKIMLDTIPLSILLEGTYDKQFQENVMKGETLPYFDINSYEKLNSFIQILQRHNCSFFVTPHILTETLSHIHKAIKTAYSFDKERREKVRNEFFKSIVPILKLINEEHNEIETVLVHNKMGHLEIGEVSLFVIADNVEVSTIISQDDFKGYDPDNILLISVEDIVYNSS